MKANGGENHVMQASLLENTPESVVIDVLVDYLGRRRIPQTLQAFLHVVPLKLNTRSVDKAELFVYVATLMAYPVVIETILS